MHPKKPLSLFFNYLLVNVMTNITFIAVGLIAYWLLPGQVWPSEILILIVAFFLLVKAGTISFVLWQVHKQARLSKAAGTHIIGFYYGRFYGLVTGAVLGRAIAGEIGMVVGTVAFFLAGSWIGPSTGRLFGGLVDRAFPTVEPLHLPLETASLPKKLLLGLYGGLTPFLFVDTAMRIELNDLPVSRLPGDWLPEAQIILLVFWLYSMIVPWLLKAQLVKATTARRLPIARSVFWMGLIFAHMPMTYGYILFLMGASIPELFLIALACSAAAVVWSIYNGPDFESLTGSAGA